VVLEEASVVEASVVEVLLEAGKYIFILIKKGSTI
jgi:hypothetical protein